MNLINEKAAGRPGPIDFTDEDRAMETAADLKLRSGDAKTFYYYKQILAENPRLLELAKYDSFVLGTALNFLHEDALVQLGMHNKISAHEYLLAQRIDLQQLQDLRTIALTHKMTGLGAAVMRATCRVIEKQIAATGGLLLLSDFHTAIWPFRGIETKDGAPGRYFNRVVRMVANGRLRFVAKQIEETAPREFWAMCVRTPVCPGRIARFVLPYYDATADEIATLTSPDRRPPLCQSLGDLCVLLGPVGEYGSVPAYLCALLPRLSLLSARQISRNE